MLGMVHFGPGVARRGGKSFSGREKGVRLKKENLKPDLSRVRLGGDVLLPKSDSCNPLLQGGGNATPSQRGGKKSSSSYQREEKQGE